MALGVLEQAASKLADPELLDYVDHPNGRM
jgi:hypothetical protein